MISTPSLRALFCCVALLACVFGQTARNEASGRAHAGGLDLAGRDVSTLPGDDFFRYANGRYLDGLVLPPDRSVYSTASILTDSVEEELRGLLTVTAGQEGSGYVGRMAGDYYAAFMDDPQIERLGIVPLLPELKAIRTAKSRKALASLMGRENASLFGSVFHLDISADLKNPERYSVQISQPYLNLPARGYYLDESYATVRESYKAYMRNLLELSGWPEPERCAEQIMQFEISIARISWVPEQERDSAKAYNPASLLSLQASAPGFAWEKFLTAAGVGQEKKFIVVEKTAVPQIAALYKRTPLATLRAWEAFVLLDHAAPYLSKAFADAAFELHGKRLSGQRQPSPRWKQGLQLVSGGNGTTQVEGAANVGDAVGQLYVSHYFQPETRAEMEALVAEVKGALYARIEALTWMAPATKVEALRKLEGYRIEIGYPDRWRDYSGLRIQSDDLIGDIERVSAFNWRFRVNRLHAPVDRREWEMGPQTVNAYNDGPLRQVVFSAALLQPPAFDPQADPAVNYGAIGAIIGHELTHGFDDQGRQFDSEGRLRDWWGSGDSKKFQAKAANLRGQFDSCEPLPGMHMNGELTMGENIADLGGLVLALDAYHASLNGNPAPIIDGLTGDQRFFLSFAQIGRSKKTEQALSEQILTDHHAPDQCRVNIEVRNLDGWYDAFHVTADERLYLKPADRESIW